MIDKKSLYLAAPLFNPAERSRNRELKTILAPWFSVYLPQEDGALLQDLLSLGVPSMAARKIIFDKDVENIVSADVVLVVLNGRGVDEGAAFELGVAWALGKPCVGYKDDFRQMLPDGDNPMISEALQVTLRTFEEVELWASEFSQNQE